MHPAAGPPTSRPGAGHASEQSRALHDNDQVIQQITACAYALELDDMVGARMALTRALDNARALRRTIAAEFDIPLLTTVDTGTAPVAPVVPVAPAASPEPVRAMLVDDTPEIRDAMRRLLEIRTRVEIVAEAENGREALDLLPVHRPELVLLDLSMPVLNGLDTLAELSPAYPDVTVVVLSGHSRDEAADRALALGAAAYVEKGGSLTGLIATLDELFPDRIARAPRERRPTAPTAATSSASTVSSGASVTALRGWPASS